MELCLDVGATFIRIAFVEKNKIIKKTKIRTPISKEAIKNALFSLIDSYLKVRKPEHICVSIAGMQKDGFIILTPNMDFSKINLKKILQKKYKIPVFVENDAKCYALAEANFGAGKSYKNFVLLTIGTGIGGAIFVGGKLIKSNTVGSEPGHMLINENEFEKISSGKAFNKIKESKGFKEASKIIGQNLGIGILNIIYLLDPEIIIIGGGFSELNSYWPSMIRTIRKKDLIKRKIKIVRAKFPDEGGLLGAGLLPKIKNATK